MQQSIKIIINISITQVFLEDKNQKGFMYYTPNNITNNWFLTYAIWMLIKN